MDFELSGDQVALRDAAASLLDDACSIARVREVADTDRHLDDDLAERMTGGVRTWSAERAGRSPFVKKHGHK